MAYKDPTDERARAARRKHYRNNKDQYYRRNEQRRARMRAYVDEIKTAPCTDCGKTYPPYVMEFDHRDRKVKLKKVSSLVVFGSWAKLVEEIKKCDLVCSNCHRIRTAKQMGYSVLV